MKKVLVLTSTLLFISILAAVDFDYDADMLTRAAAYNDAAKYDGGHIDSRLRMGLNSELTEGLNFRLAIEIGEITWGDASTGGNLGTGGINIETSELYLDYYMPVINTNIRAGLQYLADHRSLVIDHYGAGVTLYTDVAGMTAKAGILKNLEGNTLKHDDYTIFLASLEATSPVIWGYNGFVGYNDDNNDGEITFLPYVTLSTGPATLDVTPFVCHQFVDGPDKTGFGAAVKGDIDIATIKVGADVLIAYEDGLVPYCSYYQNGLFIYGYNIIHDGLNLYWTDDLYHNNDGTFISAVGSIQYPVTEKHTLFADAGVLKDLGKELNGGLKSKLVENMLTLYLYGAWGKNDNSDVNNYATGASLQLNF